MKNTNTIKTITESLSSCQTTTEEIIELLNELDSAECTDPDFPPLFVLVFSDYIKIHEQVYAIRDLLTTIETQLNELTEN